VGQDRDEFLVWGRQTTSALAKTTSTRLLACQKYMVRKKMKVEKRPTDGTHRLEPWMEFHIRSREMLEDSFLDITFQFSGTWTTLRGNGLPTFPEWGLNIVPHTHFEGNSFVEPQSLVDRSDALGRPFRWEDKFSSNWLDAVS